MTCGGILSRENPKWTCPECTTIVKTLPPAMSNKYRKMLGQAKIPKKDWRGKKSKGKKTLGDSSCKELGRTLELTSFLKAQKFSVSETGMLSTERANLLEISLNLTKDTRLDSKAHMKAIELISSLPSTAPAAVSEGEDKVSVETTTEAEAPSEPKMTDVTSTMKANSVKKKKKRQTKPKKGGSNKQDYLKMKGSPKKRKVSEQALRALIASSPSKKAKLPKSENDRPHLGEDLTIAGKASTPKSSTGSSPEDKRPKRKKLQEIDPKQKSILQFFTSCAVTPVSQRSSKSENN